MTMLQRWADGDIWSASEACSGNGISFIFEERGGTSLYEFRFSKGLDALIHALRNLSGYLRHLGYFDFPGDYYSGLFPICPEEISRRRGRAPTYINGHLLLGLGAGGRDGKTNMSISTWSRTLF
jgi:hypothetical protein